MSKGYGPRRLVADVMAAAAGRGLCPVFAGGDLDRAIEGARQVLDALHLPADDELAGADGPAWRRSAAESVAPR